MKPRRVLAATAAGACAALFVVSCGRPSPVRTLEGEPDLVKIANNEVPSGFSASAVADLDRLRRACRAMDHGIGFEQPFALNDTTVNLELLGGQCEWRGVNGGGRRGAPDLVVGLIASGGGATLDQTEAVLTGERAIANVGDRATLDPQTRTLYVLQSGRLWYVQMLQAHPGVDVASALTTLGRALAAAGTAR